MNWAVHRWDQINAIKRSISVANRRAFVFQFHGTVTDQMTVMIILMKRNVERYHVQQTSTNATIPIVYSKRTYVIKKTIAVKLKFLLFHIFYDFYHDLFLI